MKSVHLLPRRGYPLGRFALLLFKKKFLNAIRAGAKTQTIRLWRVCRLRAGQRSYIPGVGYIHITGLAAVELSELTDADAQPDGFVSADELRAELRSLYGAQLDSGYRAYRIVFRVLPPAEQTAARAARQARRAK